MGHSGTGNERQCGIFADVLFLSPVLILLSNSFKSLRKYHNKGAMLDWGEKKSGLVSLLSLVLTLAMTVVFVCTFSMKGSRLLKTGLALLLGGAYSNTYDRLRRHYVVDYISFPVKNEKLRRIVFNISDFCIMIGALCMVLGSFEK